MAENGGAAAQEHYLTLLRGLRPLFDASPGVDGAVMDNACAAVARMIMAAPTKVPMQQVHGPVLCADVLRCINSPSHACFFPLTKVIPVFLSALPLKEDFTENSTVFTCLLGLVSSGAAEVQEHMQQIVQICSHVTSDADYEIEDELRAQIAQEMARVCGQPQ